MSHEILLPQILGGSDRGYAVIMASFPTATRVIRTGILVDMGRGGSALARVVAGLLFAQSLWPALICAIMGSTAIRDGLTLCLVKDAERL